MKEFIIKRHPSGLKEGNSALVTLFSLFDFAVSSVTSNNQSNRVTMKIEAEHGGAFKTFISTWIRKLIMDPDTKENFSVENGIGPDFYTLDFEYGNSTYFGVFPISTISTLDDETETFEFGYKTRIDKKGTMISLEGQDGAGKTTNGKYVVEFLRSMGYDVVQTREPGGTPLSENLRTILLNEKMSPKTEALLMAAARMEHLNQVIKPALAAGKIVVCDRFTDSTFAYQGTGRGLQNEVLILEKLVCDNFEPDYTLFFNVTREESKKRLNERNNDINQFDLEKDAFKDRVHVGYLMRLRDHPERMVDINAMVSIEEVQGQIARWIDEIFVPANPL